MSDTTRTAEPVAPADGGPREGLTITQAHQWLSAMGFDNAAEGLVVDLTWLVASGVTALYKPDLPAEAHTVLVDELPDYAGALVKILGDGEED